MKYRIRQMTALFLAGVMLCSNMGMHVYAGIEPGTASELMQENNTETAAVYETVPDETAVSDTSEVHNTGETIPDKPVRDNINEEPALEETASEANGLEETLRAESEPEISESDVSDTGEYTANDTDPEAKEDIIEDLSIEENGEDLYVREAIADMPVSDEMGDAGFSDISVKIKATYEIEDENDLTAYVLDKDEAMIAEEEIKAAAGWYADAVLPLEISFGQQEEIEHEVSVALDNIEALKDASLWHITENGAEEVLFSLYDDKNELVYASSEIERKEMTEDLESDWVAYTDDDGLDEVMDKLNGSKDTEWVHETKDDKKAVATPSNMERNAPAGKTPGYAVFHTNTFSPFVFANILDDQEEVIYNALSVTPEAESLNEQELTPQTRKLLLTSPLKAARPEAEAPETIEQEPVSKDGQTIEKMTIRWLSKSAGSDAPAKFGRLKLAPETDYLGTMQFQIDFALSGKANHQAGAVEIVLPAYIFRTRDGNEMGLLTLSVPQDPEDGADFSYKRVGDNIVITNVHTLSAASKVMIQGSWRSVYDNETYTYSHDMIDVDTLDEGAEYPGVSDILSATLTVRTPEDNVIQMESNEIDASIDTGIEASYAGKSAYNTTLNKYYVYQSVPADIMPAEFIPENPDDYIYVRWYISGSTVGGQPYTMRASDTAEENYGAVMLGMEGMENYKSADGKTVEGILFEGYADTAKSGYVWTAYPKANLPQGEVTMVNNTVTVSVTGSDDGVTTTKTASAQAPVKMPAIYTIEKIWEDDEDVRGRRPDAVTYKIYRRGLNGQMPDYTLWKYVNVTEGQDGRWTYSWSDEGEDYEYKTEEVYIGYIDVIETRYDALGNRYDYSWGYTLRNTVYDPETHQWTFYNRYTEGWIWHHVSTINKTSLSHNNYIRNMLTDKDAQKLAEGNPVTVRYNISGNAAIAAKTVLEGVKPIRFTVTDESVALGSRTLVPGRDFEFTSVSLAEITEYTFSAEATEEGYYQRMETGEPPAVTIEGKINDEWTELAVITDASSITAKNGASVSGLNIVLPEGTTGIRAYAESESALVRYSYNVGVRLLPSEENVTDALNELTLNQYGLLRVTNSTALTLSHNGEAYRTYNNYGNAYLHGKLDKVAAYQTKSFRFLRNDSVKKIMTLLVESEIHQDSNVLSRQEYLQSIADGTIPDVKSGTFYDLLPLGVKADLDTVKLQDGDNIALKYVITNYNGTGRDLLVVKADFAPHYAYRQENRSHIYYTDETFPKEGFSNTQKITFECEYPYEEAMELGIDIRNTAAFAADEEWIGNAPGWMGEADDASGTNNKTTISAVGSDKDLISGLEPGRTDPSFLYAGAYLQGDQADLSAITSITKQVSKPGQPEWTYGTHDEVVVYEGTQYSYRISVIGETDTKTKDIFIVDALESYVPDASDTADYDRRDKRWKGTFDSVNVSEMEAAGAAPVIWYYTGSAELDAAALNAGGDVPSAVTGSPDWTTVVPEDKTRIKGIAIDARTGSDGNPYVLEDGGALVAYISMRAPLGTDSADLFNDTDKEDHTLNAHAYNDVYMDVTYEGQGGQLTNDYVHFKYTRVGILPYRLNVTKVWDDENNNDGIRPSSVTLRLYADGTDTGRDIVLSAPDWNTVIENVQKENAEGKDILYTFMESTPGYTPSFSISGNSMTVTNRHEPELIDIPVTKIWQNDRDENGRTMRPGYIRVKLYADGVYTGKNITIRGGSDSDVWTGVFEGVRKYKDAGTRIVYTIEEETVDNFLAEYDQAAGTITNRYYPYGDISVTKTVRDATPAAEDKSFTFTLTLKDKNGNDETDSYRYEHGTRTGRIRNGDTFELKDGETFVIKDIPVGVRYWFKEDKTDGFRITSTENTSGTVRSGIRAEQQAAFTNTYVTKGTASLKAKKTLTGRELSPAYFSAYVAEAGGSIKSSTANGADGWFNFPDIGYTNADDGQTHTYTIAETAGSRPGYTYSEEHFTAEVTPHDNGDGTMTVSVVYKDGENQVIDYPEIRNEYHASGSTVLKAWKTIEGRELQANEFEFELLDSDMNVIQTKKNGADGSIVFDAIPFTEENVGNTYTYYIREKKGTDQTVNYDSSIYAYTVFVVDNGDGTLSFTQTPLGAEEYTVEDTESRYNKAVTYGDPFTDVWTLTGVDREGNPITTTAMLDDIRFEQEWRDPSEFETTPPAQPLFYDSSPNVYLYNLGYSDLISANGTVIKSHSEQDESITSGLHDAKSIADAVRFVEFILNNANISMADMPTERVTRESLALSGREHLYNTIVNEFGLPSAENATDYREKLMGGLIDQAPIYFQIMARDLLGTQNHETGQDVMQWIPHVHGDYIFRGPDVNMEITHYPMSIQGVYQLQEPSVIDPDNLLDYEWVQTDENIEAHTEIIMEDMMVPKKLIRVTEERALPVFKNTLKDGSLTISKYTTERSGSNPEKMFRFKVVLTGPEISDGEISWDLEQRKYPYYEVNFDANGGYFNGDVMQPTNTLVYKRNPVTGVYEHANGTFLTPERIGFNFEGWYEDEDLTIPYSYENSISDEKAVHAKWEAADIGGVSWNASGDGTLTIEPESGTAGIMDYQISGIKSWPWYRQSAWLRKVDIRGRVIVADGMSLQSMFANGAFADGEAKLANLDVAGAVSMEGMFSASTFTSLDIGNWNTRNVRNMEMMFYYCTDLTGLDVARWNVSNVTDMSSMFCNCRNITSLDLSGWDTGKVTDMNHMFQDCTNLTALKLGPNFKFPAGSNIGLSGTWKNGSYGPYTSEQLVANYDGSTMAGTWIKVSN